MDQRITEYGIDIGNYGGNHQARAGDYASYVNWLRSGWNNYIRAAHVFIAAKSDGQDPYVLQDAEAATLANDVGCVGQ